MNGMSEGFAITIRLPTPVPAAATSTTEPSRDGIELTRAPLPCEVKLATKTHKRTPGAPEKLPEDVLSVIGGSALMRMRADQGAKPDADTGTQQVVRNVETKHLVS